MNKQPPPPEKVFICRAARGSGKTMWAEYLRRRAVDEGKTVLVMRKGGMSE